MSNPSETPAAGVNAADEQIQQTQTEKQQIHKIPKILFDKHSVTTEKIKILAKEKEADVLTDKGILPTNEEVYDALIKIFGIDIEKGSRQVYKATFYDDYATVDKLDFNDIEKLIDVENRNEGEIILRKGKLLFQFEVGELSLTTLVKNLKKMSFTIKYKSKELIRARNETEYAIYDIVIKNPTSAKPIVEMLVESIDDDENMGYAHQIELKDVVTSLLESQKYNHLVKELAKEMKAEVFNEDVMKKWESIDLSKYNRDVTILYLDLEYFNIRLCNNTKDDCQQDIIEQRRKLLDELIQRMNAKLQKIEIIPKHYTDGSNVTGIEVVSK